MTDNNVATRARGGPPSVVGSSWWSTVWKPFWAVPVACASGAVLAGVLLPMFDEKSQTTVPYVFHGGPSGARDLLGTIATGIISMTGLVFSITMVVLQLASSQFTPRVLKSFLDSRITQFTLGVFTASFVFALTVTRSIRGDYGETGTFVPQVSVTAAFVLVLASVGCFLAFIHHITSSIQVSQVISRIGEQTLDLADAMYPQEAIDGDVETGPTWSPDPGTARAAVSTRTRHGALTFVDYDALVRFAARHDAVVTIDRPVGQFLTEGQDMLRVWGVARLDEKSCEELYTYVGMASEREMRQDVAFGIRQLVDIAERALSPGINDPTTATQCIDELHRILRRLVSRASPSPYVTDTAGRVRVVHDPQSIEGHLRLAVEEIAHYGADSVQVPARLRAMLDDLETASAQRYLPAIRRARDLIDGPRAHTG